ncbi:amine oxidase, partial [Mycobacterium kansasii]
EYAGARGVGGLFPSWSNLGRPRYLLMLGEITRFHRLATQLLRHTASGDEVTLDEFLHRHGFSRYFTDRFITPLVAAVWSCPPGEALRYPARY